MSRGGLRRLGGLLGPAVLLTLGCGEEIKTSPPIEGASGTGDSATTDTQDTGTTDPACAIQLSDVAQGIGGFVLDGAAEDDHAGLTVSGAGDVNGDGLADVVVGAYLDGPNHAGRAYVVFGKPDTAAVALADVAGGVGGFLVDREADDEYAGWSLSGAGDVNGDGLADVVVGVYQADANGLQYAGRSYVVLGKEDTDTVQLADLAQGIGGFVLDGEAEYDSSGFSVSGAGDVNGDGLADVVVGALGGDANAINCGRTYVVFGKTDTAVVSLADVTGGIGGFALDGEAERDHAGESVSGAGDVNGDGLADVVVGARSHDANGLPYSGRTYVVFGKASTDRVSLADVAQGTGGFAADGEAEYNLSGRVSGAGDVNGDGLADVIVGAPHADANGISSGRAYVVFGKSDGSRVSLAEVRFGIGGFAINGEAAHDYAGRVSGAGDVNGDGFADVIVGAPSADPNGSYSGRTYVVFGKEDTAPVSLADVARGVGGVALDGEAEDDDSGWSVSGAGDINGDGVPDIVVGARSADPNGIEDAGRTYVVFGGDLSCGE